MMTGCAYYTRVNHLPVLRSVFILMDGVNSAHSFCVGSRTVKPFSGLITENCNLVYILIKAIPMVLKLK